MLAGLEHSTLKLPGSLRCPEVMRVVGNQVWKFKNKGIRLRPSHVPESLTREGGGEARPACGAVS